MCKENRPEHRLSYVLVSLSSKFSNSVLPKILIYCKSIADVANIYFYLHSEFDNKNVIEMFLSETTVEKKKYIIDELSKSDSEMKVIVATSALGMGIDIKSCHSVIMYGRFTIKCSRLGTRVS